MQIHAPKCILVRILTLYPFMSSELPITHTQQTFQRGYHPWFNGYLTNGVTTGRRGIEGSSVPALRRFQRSLRHLDDFSLQQVHQFKSKPHPRYPSPSLSGSPCLSCVSRCPLPRLFLFLLGCSRVGLVSRPDPLSYLF